MSPAESLIRRIHASGIHGRPLSGCPECERMRKAAKRAPEVEPHAPLTRATIERELIAMDERGIDVAAATPEQLAYSLLSMIAGARVALSAEDVQLVLAADKAARS